MNDEFSSPTAAPWRFRFSLGTMFLVVTCVAIFLASSRIIKPADGGYIAGALFVYFFLVYWFFCTRRVIWAANMIVALVSLWALALFILIVLGSLLS